MGEDLGPGDHRCRVAARVDGGVSRSHVPVVGRATPQRLVDRRSQRRSVRGGLDAVRIRSEVHGGVWMKSEVRGGLDATEVTDAVHTTSSETVLCRCRYPDSPSQSPRILDDPPHLSPVHHHRSSGSHTTHRVTDDAPHRERLRSGALRSAA